MATKHISDKQVCEAYKESKEPPELWPYQILQRNTGQSEKVCYRAMERAAKRGLIDYGTSLRSGWLTTEGDELLAKSNT